MTGPCLSPIEIEQCAAGEGDVTRGAHLDACPICAKAVEDARANEAILGRLRDAVAGVDRGDGIDGYTLGRELSRGGQGVVHEATQLATGRSVAIKRLVRGAFATSRQRRRLEREIELLAALEHPNVVSVLDAGMSRDGRMYLVMPLIDGTAVDRWVHSNRDLALDDVLAIFESICAGIHHAHQHGVIHRDIKPSNVLVDRNGRPCVLDFGLARPIASTDDELTEAGMFLGTVMFVAPELIGGDPERVDVRSDVYALGVMLYQLVSGHLPYEEHKDLRSFIDEVTGRDAPAVRSVASPRFAINDELDTIVRTAMNHDRERRYQSAAALGDDVARLRAGEAIDAKRDSTMYVMRKAIARHRLPVAAALFAAAILVVATAALSVAYGRATTEAEKVRQINLFLEDTLGSVSPDRPGDDVAVRELLDEAVQWIDIVLGDEPEVEAAIRNTVGNGYRALGLYENAAEQHRRALETRLEVLGPSHPDVAQSLTAMALVRRGQERYDEAETLLRRALDIRRDRLGATSYEVSLTLANLALVRRDMGDLEHATALQEESMAIRQDLFGPVHRDIAMCLFNLGDIAERSGDAALALDRHGAALDMRREVLHEAHPDLARSFSVVARLHLERGEAAAEPLAREARDLVSAAHGPDNWRTAEADVLLARCMAAIGERAAAVALLEPAIERLGTVLGGDDERTRAAEAALEAIRD